MAAGPCRSMIAVHRVLISASASSQVMRWNWPVPLRPVRFSGKSTRSGL
jgi:hypothetical protein